MSPEGSPVAPPAESAGALLLAERERQGFSRADIAQRLHISAAQIEALENGDVSRFPKGPFLKGFTRSYARALGIDPEAVVSLLSDGSPPAASPGIVVPSQNIRFDPLGQRLANPYVKAAGIAAAVIVLGFAAMYWWLFIRPAPMATSSVRKPAAESSAGAPLAVPAAPEAGPPGKVETSPPAPDAVQPPEASRLSTPAPGPAPDAPATTIVSVPMPVSPVPAATPAQPSAERGGEANIRLTFRQASWIEIVDAAGQTLIARSQAAGTVSELAGKPPLRIIVGNAAGVGLAFNGREVDLAPHTKFSVARLTLP